MSDTIETVTEELKTFIAEYERRFNVQQDILNQLQAKAKELPWSPQAGTKAGHFLPAPAEFKALGGSTDSGGGYLLPRPNGTEFFDRLRPESVVLASGVRQIQMESASLRLPGIGTSGTAAVYAENAEISANDQVFTAVTLTPRKVAALVRYSNELFADTTFPEVRRVLEYDLERQVATVLDAQFLHGNSTAPNMRGLRNTTSANVTYMGTDGGVLTVDAIRAAISRLEASNAKAGAIIMHPRDWANLKAAKTGISGDNRYLLTPDPSAATNKSLFGVPVFTSSNVLTNETRGNASGVCSYALVFDPSQVVVGRRQDVQILLDRSRYMEYDQTAIRLTSRWDIGVLNAAAVEVIAGIIAS